VQQLSPYAVIAEMRLIVWRAPVVATTGVCPTGAQVVPAWVIRPQSGLVEEVDRRPVFFAWARIAGNFSVFHCSTASGFCW
jgi:hypothetical protein